MKYKPLISLFVIAFFIIAGCNTNNPSSSSASPTMINSQKSEETVIVETGQKEDRTVQLTSLVQRMLQPTCSGILYTMNPVTGENQIIIESTIGINALLTDGKISPDYLSYDADGKVLHRRTGKTIVS